MPWKLPSILVVAGLSVANLAAAHQGLVAGTRPFFDTEGGLVGGATTWGVVLKEDERWLRVCEESFRTSPAFAWRAQDGRVLLGGDDGLYVTTDGGCTYSLVTGPLEGFDLSDLAVHPGDVPALYVTTSSAGRDNGLFVSHDDGVSFAPTGLSVAERILSRVAVSEAGSTLYVSALNTATGASSVFVSTDAGASFIEHALDGYIRAKVLGIDVDGARVVIAGSTADGPSDLIVADPTFAELDVVASFEETIAHYTAFDGARFVVLNTALHRETDEGFVPVPSGPANCLLTNPMDGALWGCGQLLDLGHFLSSNDGATFDLHIPFGLVEERVCPAGTAGASFCPLDPFFDAGVGAVDAGPADAGAPSDAGDEEPPPDCQCDAASPSPPWAPLPFVAALWWARRRRHPRLHTAAPTPLARWRFER